MINWKYSFSGCGFPQIPPLLLLSLGVVIALTVEHMMVFSRQMVNGLHGRLQLPPRSSSQFLEWVMLSLLLPFCLLERLPPLHSAHPNLPCSQQIAHWASPGELWASPMTVFLVMKAGGHARGEWRWVFVASFTPTPPAIAPGPLLP